MSFYTNVHVFRFLGEHGWGKSYEDIKCLLWSLCYFSNLFVLLVHTIFLYMAVHTSVVQCIQLNLSIITPSILLHYSPSVSLLCSHWFILSFPFITSSPLGFIFITSQFFDRLKLFGMPAKHQPDFIYLRHVPLRKVHLFTVTQLTCLVLLWVIKTSPAAIIFPMMVSQAPPASGLCSFVFPSTV